jgi:hypothetical protein
MHAAFTRRCPAPREIRRLDLRVLAFEPASGGLWTTADPRGGTAVA